MSYCSMCTRIIKIRKRQGKNYYQDLCGSCRETYKRKKSGKKVAFI